MTQIKGYQIQPKTVDFGVFVEDSSGNIQLPANVQLNGDEIITKSKLAVAKVVEKITADSAGNYVISKVQAGDVEVMINGVVQTPGDDYTMDGQTIKFTTAPGSSDKVVAAYITFAD